MGVRRKAKFKVGKLARIVNLVGHVAAINRNTVEVRVLTADSGYQNVICYKENEVEPVKAGAGARLIQW